MQQPQPKAKGDEVSGARPAEVNRSATCVLVARATPDEAPRRHRINNGEAVLGSSGTVKIEAKGALPQHARVEHVGGAWTVRALRGATVRVNGVRARHPVSLETGDRIGIGEGMAIFCPDIPDIAGLGPLANGFSRARHHLGRALELGREDKDFVAALAELEESIDGSERGAVLQRCVKLMNEEKWTEALTEIDKVLRTLPNHAGALFHKAICLSNLSRLEECWNAAEAARDKAGDDTETRDDAVKLLTKLREAAPRVALNGAIKLMNADRFYDAERSLTEAARRYPKDAAILLHLAICQAKNGNISGARVTLDKAERHTGSDFELAGEIRDLQRKLRGYR